MTDSLQGRARTVGQVLLGYFEVPFNMDDPVTIAINPAGDAARSAVRCASSTASSHEHSMQRIASTSGTVCWRQCSLPSCNHRV